MKCKFFEDAFGEFHDELPTHNFSGNQQLRLDCFEMTVNDVRANLDTTLKVVILTIIKII